MPGESVRDWTRRNYKWNGLDPDLAGPATDGPRFAGESEPDYLQRLLASRSYAPPLPNEEDDADDDS